MPQKALEHLTWNMRYRNKCVLWWRFLP